MVCIHHPFLIGDYRMLHKIIGSIDQESFFNNYFEKKPLFQRAESSLINMFTLADFDRYLIAGEGMLHNLVRITKDGVAITIPTYHGQATTQREFVLEAFKSGATLKLEDLDNRHSDIAKICKSLEDIFGGYVFAKPFLTGANFPGLDTHFDTTEVFVVQLEGRKVWHVWDKVIDNPTLPLQQNFKDVDLGAPSIEVILEPGDILYIPAGAPHSARCLDSHSLHMAIGLQPIKIFEVLEGYLRLMSEHIVELRQNIYPFTERDLLDKNTKLLLDRLKKVPFDVIKADFDIAYSATKHETCDRRLETLAASHAITESTKLRLRQGVDIQARTGDGSISIYFSSTISPGKPLVSRPSNVTLPDYCQGEIDYICSSGLVCFTPSQLSGDLNLNSCSE